MVESLAKGTKLWGRDIDGGFREYVVGDYISRGSSGIVYAAEKIEGNKRAKKVCLKEYCRQTNIGECVRANYGAIVYSDTQKPATEQLLHIAETERTASDNCVEGTAFGHVVAIETILKVYRIQPPENPIYEVDENDNPLTVVAVMNDLRSFKSIKDTRDSMISGIKGNKLGDDEIALYKDIITKDLSNYTIGSIFNIILQTMQSVNTIHNNGWVHRDIKPENLLLEGVDKNTAEDYFTRSILIDLGSAVAEEAPENDVSGIIPSTEGYIPPVGLENKWTKDDDLYQVFCVFYYLALNEFPSERYIKMPPSSTQIRRVLKKYEWKSEEAYTRTVDLMEAGLRTYPGKRVNSSFVYDLIVRLKTMFRSVPKGGGQPITFAEKADDAPRKVDFATALLELGDISFQNGTRSEIYKIYEEIAANQMKDTEPDPREYKELIRLFADLKDKLISTPYFSEVDFKKYKYRQYTLTNGFMENNRVEDLDEANADSLIASIKQQILAAKSDNSSIDAICDLYGRIIYIYDKTEQGISEVWEALDYMFAHSKWGIGLALTKYIEATCSGEMEICKARRYRCFYENDCGDIHDRIVGFIRYVMALNSYDQDDYSPELLLCMIGETEDLTTYKSMLKDADAISLRLLHFASCSGLAKVDCYSLLQYAYDMRLAVLIKMAEQNTWAWAEYYHLLEYNWGTLNSIRVPLFNFRYTSYLRGKGFYDQALSRAEKGLNSVNINDASYTDVGIFLHLHEIKAVLLSDKKKYDELIDDTQNTFNIIKDMRGIRCELVIMNMYYMQAQAYYNKKILKRAYESILNCYNYAKKAGKNALNHEMGRTILDGVCGLLNRIAYEVQNKSGNDATNDLLDNVFQLQGLFREIWASL